MEYEALLVTLFAISTAVTGIVELIKATPFVAGLSEDRRAVVLFIASLVVGVIGTIGAQTNLLADNAVYGQANPVLGMIITGLVVGMGSKTINAVVSLLYWQKEASKTRALE